MSEPGGRFSLAGLVGVTVLVADQVTKAIVQRTLPLHEVIPLLPFLALDYERNTGAAFSLLASAPPVARLVLFVGVTLGAMGLLVSSLRRTPVDRPWTIGALGGILGGAAGNLICRLRYGEVVDFLLLHWRAFRWPVFNVADSAISVGVVILVLASLRGERE